MLDEVEEKISRPKLSVVEFIQSEQGEKRKKQK